MKTSQDPRHKKRREIVKTLFAESFTTQPTKNLEVKEIIKNLKKIDLLIEKSAPAWPLDKLNRIDLSVLRLAVYELEKKENPPKVIIDEAVELAKEFGSENSGSFVNGVLGTIYKKEDK
jgi:N utilization substance protein B